MVGTVSQCRSQISYSFNLIPNESTGSKRNILNNKNSNQHNMLVSQPNQDLLISESSAKQDLQDHVHETTNSEGRNSTYLMCSVMNSRVQGLKTSRSTPLWLLWSFEQELMVESTTIQLNLQVPLTCSCTYVAQIWTNFFEPKLDSYSIMLNEQDYAIKLMSYVKKFQVWSERKKWREWKFSDLELGFCANSVMIGLLYEVLMRLQSRLGFG